LSVIESVFNHGDSCHVIVAGDFNTDFNRQSVYTAATQDFCLKSDMYPIRDHSSCMIDYTYNYNMKTFSFIDHFLLSNQLFHTAVSKACVMHDMDNVSDHDAVCLYLDVHGSRLKYESRHFNVRPSWAKADANHVDHYRKVLQSKLKNMEIPHSAIGSQNVFCTDEEHFVALNQYVEQLTEACLKSAEATIHFTKPCGESGRIPGWSEFVAPLKNQSVFWHNLWFDCGKPHNDVVADIMRKSRGRYHAASDRCVKIM